MTAIADQRREARRRSMLPGSPRDTVVQIAKVALPILAGILAVVLIVIPLTLTQEFSFLLSKDSAMKAGERMRIQEAAYRGETAEGENFLITAASGVQKSSAVPVVVLSDLSARIERADGPATVTAPSGEFLMQQKQVIVNGPVTARSTSGYSLDGERITVDLNSSRVQSAHPVSGTLPMGRFASGNFSADIEGRHVILDNRVTLRITPNRN